MTAHGQPDSGTLSPVTDETRGPEFERGAEITRRRLALGLTSARKFEEAAKEDTGLGRDTIARAEAGFASKNTYNSLEAWLSRQELENGVTDEPAQPVRIEMHGVYGVDEIIAVGDPDQVADAVGKILERLKSQEE